MKSKFFTISGGLAFISLLLVPAITRAQQTVFTPNCFGTNDTAAFQSIITGAGGNARTIEIPYKSNTAQRCALGTITIPSHITIDNTRGSGINRLARQTITVQGAIVNPPDKTLWFGSGSNVLAGKTYAVTSANRPVGDGVTDNRVAIQALINAAAAENGGVIDLGPGRFKVSSPGLLVSSSNITIQGAGMGATTIEMSSATGNTIATSGTVKNFQVRDLTFAPSVTRTNSVTNNNEIYCPSFGTSQTDSTQSVFLSDLQFINVNNGIFLGNISSASGRAFVNNIHAFRFNRFMYLVRVLDLWFTNSSIGTDSADGVGIYLDGGNEGCNFSNLGIINGIAPGSATGYGMQVQASLYTTTPSRFIRAWGVYLDSYHTGLKAVDGVDFSFTNCWFSDRPGRGAEISGTADEYKFIGCDFYNSADNGLSIGGAGRHLVDSCSFIGNNTDGNSAASPLSAGLLLDQSSGGITRINNILARNTAAFPGPQSYGIWTVNTAGTAYSIRGGDVLGNAADPVIGINPLAGVSAPNSRMIEGVIAFRTENAGSGTVASGATKAVITHNLAYTPTVNQIRIDPTNNPTNNVRHWVSAASATTFTVTTSGDPGASGLSFGWSAKIQ